MRQTMAERTVGPAAVRPVTRQQAEREPLGKDTQGKVHGAPAVPINVPVEAAEQQQQRHRRTARVGFKAVLTVTPHGMPVEAAAARTDALVQAAMAAAAEEPAPEQPQRTVALTRVAVQAAAASRVTASEGQAAQV